MPKIKIQSFCKILKTKWYHAKVLLKRFHLNGHTIGFHQQTQKLELHYMSTCLSTCTNFFQGVNFAIFNSNSNVL